MIEVLCSAEALSVRVSNVYAGSAILTAGVFEKGVRETSEDSGSGHGLYVAQLVARQHGTKVRVESKRIGIERMACTFSIDLKPEKGS
jgi:sensor histidine kinase regulating citrate/malate metabolism